MKKNRNILFTAIAWAMVCVFLFPIIWLALTSFRIENDLFSPGFKISGLTITQYFKVFQQYKLSKYLVNSIILSTSVVILNLLIGTPAAYAVSRFKIPFKSSFMMLLLIVRMVPVISVSIPLFLFISYFHLLDTKTSLVIAHTAFKLPMTIWLIMIFFLQVPKELEEAARIDGASNMRVFLNICVPNVIPGLGVASIFAFILTWNDLLVALILTNSKNSQPSTVGLSHFLLEYGVDWGPLSAAGIIVLIPVLLFALISGESLIKGLSTGAVKG